jgi:predicted transcriptional regulator
VTVAATSIKIPRRLKSKIERLARRSGETSHAFMLRALQGQVEAAERYQVFVQEGIRADEAMLPCLDCVSGRNRFCGDEGPSVEKVTVRSRGPFKPLSRACGQTRLSCAPGS